MVVSRRRRGASFRRWKSNINQLIPMGSQGKDGLGAPIKNLLCKVYKALGRDE
jgi:hypothetical protein